MRWKGRRQSANLEDRRGGGGFGGGGFRIPVGGRGGGFRIPTGRGGVGQASGGSLLLIVVVVVGLWLFAGINPLQLLDMVSGEGGGPYVGQTVPAGGGGSRTAASDEQKQFVATVLAETEDTWNRVFEQSGADYPEPDLVLYSGAVQTHCGVGSAAVGPFYCPNDQKVYLDLDFFDLMRSRFRSPGDFAQAYVIAHEVGHHVQKQTGVLDDFNQRRQAMGEREANAMSVRVELQADCYAGIWAHDAGGIGLLEEGDIEEALNAAHQIGDDMMQKRSQGYVVPDAFNHGTSEQRARWFQRGYEDGDVGACDTLNAESL